MLEVSRNSNYFTKHAWKASWLGQSHQRDVVITSHSSLSETSPEISLSLKSGLWWLLHWSK